MLYKPVKWTISNHLIHDINAKLFDVEEEIAGTISFDRDDSFDANEVKFASSNGTKTSVHTPLSLVNFHTHPLSAYRLNRCVWGWPSGEDLRESIKIALNGNINHCVFTLEGIYTTQMNRMFIKYMKTLTNSQRGLIISSVERYFKTFHRNRTIEYQSKKKRMSPLDFVDLCNNFSLVDIKKYLNKKQKCYGITALGKHDNKQYTVHLKEIPDIRLFYMVVFIADGVRSLLAIPKKRYTDLCQWTHEHPTFQLSYKDDDLSLYFYDLKKEERSLTNIVRRFLS
jgi:hypothetical protein